MKHPLYKDTKLLTIMNNLKNPNFKNAMISGASKFGTEFDDFLSTMFFKVFVNQSIIKNGHVYIKVTEDEWNSEISAKTLSKIKLSGFKLPFKAGYIDLGDGSHMSYSVFKNGELNDKFKDFGLHSDISQVDGRYSRDIDIILLAFKSRHIPILTNLTIEENLNLIKENNVTMSDLDIKKIFDKINIFFSVLLYVSTYNSDKTRIVSSIIKGVKSAAKGIGKHTVNVIKLKQHIARYEDVVSDGKTGRKSDKKWIVRGHWRNQFYKSIDTYKPKWIDPYWKGINNKEEVQKVYELEKGD